MRPKIKTGYPVVIHGKDSSKTGIVCNADNYEYAGQLDVVYVDPSFKARRTTVVWRATRFEWLDPAAPGINVESDPAMERFVTTVKNGRY